MSWVIFVAGGVAIAALSSFITAKIIGKRCRKKIDDIYAESSEELSKMKHERDEMYRSFVLTGDPETSKERAQLWKKIEEETKKGRKAMANEHPEEIDLDAPSSATSDIGARRDVEDRNNYQKILTHTNYISNEPQDSTESVIRKSAQNGIVEIEPWEARQNPRFPIEDLYFNEGNQKLYLDDESELRDDEVPSYVGYSSDQLSTRFMTGDEPSDIYVINPDHQKIYNVYVRSGEWGR